MKKIFTFLAAMFVAFAVNAADQYPDPAVNNSLSAAVAAVGDDEVIYLEAGIYTNSKTASNDYTKLRSGKHYTIKAIDGQKAIIKYEVPFQIREAASAKFIGIKFDGESIHSDYDNYFHVNDAVDNSLEFENCEFTNVSASYIIYVGGSKKLSSLVFKNCKFHDNSCGRAILNEGTITKLEIKNSTISDFTNTDNSLIDNYSSATMGELTMEGCTVSGISKKIIVGQATSHLGTCTINNCYFHDNAKNIIIFSKSTIVDQHACDKLVFTNSTIANSTALADYTSTIDVHPYNDVETDGVKVIVDHCTFYNNPTITSDHSAIRPYNINDVTISNCIF